MEPSLNTFAILLIVVAVVAIVATQLRLLYGAGPLLRRQAGLPQVRPAPR